MALISIEHSKAAFGVYMQANGCQGHSHGLMVSSGEAWRLARSPSLSWVYCLKATQGGWHVIMLQSAS